MEPAPPSTRTQIYFYTSGVRAPELPTLSYSIMQRNPSREDIGQRPDLYAYPPTSDFGTYANIAGNDERDGVYYMEGSMKQQPMMASSYPSDFAQASNGTLSGISVESQQRRHRANRIEEPSGYWVLPHTKHHKSPSQSSSTPTRYVTPGGRYLHRKPKKHTAGVQFRGAEYTVYSTAPPGGVTEGREEVQQYSSLSRKVDPNISVTFHYNPVDDLESAFNNDLLVRMQAQCRAYLAKLEKRKKLKEDDAVRCIQRNAAAYFDPWIRLILALKPHLKRHRLEDEIIQLKSELERYKAMVKVLRYENVAYQDKISRLLQLLDQMHPGGVSGDLVNRLIKELSMAVSDHQKQWNSMVSGLPQEAYGTGLQMPPAAGGAGTGDPLLDSSYQQARDNAEFYRNQLEMLREEVDDQNTRTSQHYEEKIGTLSERVEHLQNLLTQENFRVERLNGELELANAQLNEAHENEANLENMINELKAALKRKQTVSVGDYPQTPGSNDGFLIQAKQADTQHSSLPPILLNGEAHDDVAPAEQSAQALLDSIRNYFLMNQEAYDAIKNTPLASGGQLDIFTARQPDQFASGGLTPEGSNTFFSQPNVRRYLTTPDHSMNSIFNSQTHVENFNVSKLSEELEARIEALQQQLEEETGYRDDLELESQEMRNRIANLTRQLRRQRDEHEEEILEKDQAHLKKVRELTETVDDLGKEKAALEKRCADLQIKLDDLRQAPELSDEDEVTDELRDTHARVVAENKRYLKELEHLQEEFDQFKAENNLEEVTKQVAERDLKISQLEVAQHHAKSDIEILNVRLQNANSLLEENEQRLRVATKERQNLVHRIAQLETERDTAVREAAAASGRAGAEREASAARQRDLENIKEERDLLRREVLEVKISLTESTTKAQAEKVALEKRLAELETTAAKRENDLKMEVERLRDQVENLQQELTETQKLESTAKTDNRHLKRQVTDLQDSLDTYVRKVGDLERRSSDLYAELDRAKASLTAARETATLLRERQTRANEDCSMMLADDVQVSDDESSSAYEAYSRTSADNFNSSQTLDRPLKRQNMRSSSKGTPYSSNRSLSKPGASSTLPHYGSYKQLASHAKEKRHQPRIEYFSAERKKPFSDANTTDSDLDAN
ncbi:hypothetical protein AAHC03_09246 [Spirometra sp. Aus1]